MRRTNTLSFILGLVLLTSFSMPLAHAEGLDIQAFEESLYPFMRKNCSECHSETAIYPVGPSHSHSDKKIAFSTFQKYLNPSDLKSSKFIKTGSNKHFCNEHSYNCDKADQVVEELKTRFLKFSNSVQSNTASNSPNSESSIQTISNYSTQLLIYSIPGDGETLTLSIGMDKYKDNDHRKIMDVSLRGSKGTFFIEGLEIKKNGQNLTQMHGMEKLNRHVIFSQYSPNPMSIKLNPSNPVVNFKAGDKIEVELKGFKSSTYSDSRCEKMGLFEEHFGEKSLTSLHFRIRGWTGTDKINFKEACHQLTSRLGDGSAKAVIWNEIQRSERVKVHKILSAWAESLRSKSEKVDIPKTIKTSIGMLVSCLQSETRAWYCRGYNGYGSIESSGRQVVDLVEVNVGEEIVNMNAGHLGLAMKGKSGKHYFRSRFYEKDLNDLVEKVKNRGRSILSVTPQYQTFSAIDSEGVVYFVGDSELNKEVVFPEPIKQVSALHSSKTFALTRSGKIFSVGDKVFGGAHALTEIKTPKPIQKISTSLKSLCALDIDSNLLCAGDIQYNSNSALDRESFDLIPLRFLNKKVKDVQINSYLICITNFDSTIECASLIRSELAENLTGIKGIKFHEFSPPYPKRKTIDFALSFTSACFVFDDGNSTCAGNNDYGSVGPSVGAAVPVYTGERTFVSKSPYPFMHENMLKE